MWGAVMTMLKTVAPKWSLLLLLIGLFLSTFAFSGQAHAGEVFAGVSAHEVDTPLTCKLATELARSRHWR
jgi:hypothetical protein